MRLELCHHEITRIVTASGWSLALVAGAALLERERVAEARRARLAA